MKFEIPLYVRMRNLEDSIWLDKELLVCVVRSMETRGFDLLSEWVT